MLYNIYVVFNYYARSSLIFDALIWRVMVLVVSGTWLVDTIVVWFARYSRIPKLRRWAEELMDDIDN